VQNYVWAAAIGKFVSSLAIKTCNRIAKIVPLATEDESKNQLGPDGNHYLRSLCHSLCTVAGIDYKSPDFGDRHHPQQFF